MARATSVRTRGASRRSAARASLTARPAGYHDVHNQRAARPRHHRVDEQLVDVGAALGEREIDRPLHLSAQLHRLALGLALARRPAPLASASASANI